MGDSSLNSKSNSEKSLSLENKTQHNFKQDIVNETLVSQSNNISENTQMSPDRKTLPEQQLHKKDALLNNQSPSKRNLRDPLNDSSLIRANKRICGNDRLGFYHQTTPKTLPNYNLAEDDEDESDLMTSSSPFKNETNHNLVISTEKSEPLQKLEQVSISRLVSD